MIAKRLSRLLISGTSLGIHAAALLNLNLVFAFGQADAGREAGGRQVTNGASTFAVATVKPNVQNDGRWGLGFTRDGYAATGVSLYKIIQDAYGIYEDDRIVGEPSWVDSQKYDIETKVDGTEADAYQRLDRDQRRRMLQLLLAERFGLAVHHEDRPRPVYALIIAKTSPKMKEVKTEDLPGQTVKGLGGTVKHNSQYELAVESMTMTNFAQLLSHRVGRIVLDKTGLVGRYDFELDWAPIEAGEPSISPKDRSPFPADPEGSGIFTALDEQLGLKLKSMKAPVDIVVIDRVEKPTDN